MAGQAQILLINGSPDQHWHNILKKALSPLGSLQAEREKDSMELIVSGNYDLIIIDAMAVENVPRIVARIRAQQPDICIVVTTASPTWKRAREAFQAGATDYMIKALDGEEILAAIKAALVKARRPGSQSQKHK